MRKFTMNYLALLMLISGFSCGLEKVAPGNEGQNAVDIKSDADFKPTDDDLKCLHDSDCEMVDIGCCHNEKRIAMNKEKYSAAHAKINQQCRSLRKEFADLQVAEEKKTRKSLEKNLCKAGGRDRSFNPQERFECKKALPRLKLQDRAKDPKKYDEDEKAYNIAPGKCEARS